VKFFSRLMRTGTSFRGAIEGYRTRVSTVDFAEWFLIKRENSQETKRLQPANNNRALRSTRSANKTKLSIGIENQSQNPFFLPSASSVLAPSCFRR